MSETLRIRTRSTEVISVMTGDNIIRIEAWLN